MAEFLMKALICFLSGSVPFAWFAVKTFKGTDVRRVADGNPGAVNVFRACGPVIGSSVLLLDFLKGALPVYLLKAGTSYRQLPILAIMPVLGHAFSPWLGFKGGKAITTSFGIWTALTLWEAPMAMGFGAFISLVLFKGKPEYLKLLPMMASLAAYLALFLKGTNLWALFAYNVAVLAFMQFAYARKSIRRAKA
ncbi:MAG TPA: glycerol-3-phosphate acyltransferase [Bacillota bacterium]|nr:glycerol-3-phosphate acyltransferase [Bacillota bacterium]HOH09923.1 glycerol-3-phosphate acyltransferase [Bacillota bacterium]HPI01980.1 glycerol-3-phosphate acyltransferase [Bacillota bacterium]HPM63380.1 glycerol-3-phosphate acyltransferase [Bacillota bacterium]HQJ24767.1 glycerol-3-phosphate acyltransferase [Bacillota bacterium]